MFGLAKFLKSKPIELKAIASDNFMESLSNINKIKDQKISLNIPQNNYDDLMNKALDVLLKFANTSSNENNLLKESAYLLRQANEIKKSRPEPYFYLSYIFYLIDDLKLAIKYLNVAKSINPSLFGLDDLFNQIQNTINNKTSKVSSPNINKISSVKSIIRRPDVLKR